MIFYPTHQIRTLKIMINVEGRIRIVESVRNDCPRRSRSVELFDRTAHESVAFLDRSSVPPVVVLGVSASLLHLHRSIDDGVPDRLTLAGSHPLRRLLFVLPRQVLQVFDLALFSLMD